MKAASSRWARPRTSICARARASSRAFWARSTGSAAWAFVPRRSACCAPGATDARSPRPRRGHRLGLPRQLRAGAGAPAQRRRRRGAGAAPRRRLSARRRRPLLLERRRRDDLLMKLRTWFLLPAWLSMARAVRRAARHRAGLQLPDARRLRRHRTAVDLGELSAPLRSAVSHDSVALVRHGAGRHGAVPAAGVSRGAVHLARHRPQESLPATRDAALLDQFPGAHLRLDVPAARYRPDQHRTAGARHHPQSAAAAL